MRGWVAGMLAAAALCAAGVTAPAAAYTPNDAIERIEPRIDRRSFQMLIEGLRLDGDQRLVVGILYSDYATGLDALANDLDDRLAAAGRQRVEDALSGRIFIERSELRRLRVALQRAVESIWPAADRLAEDLILNTRSLLDDRESAAFEAALCDLRRAMYLQPRLADSADEGYAGHGLDAIRLVNEALRPGNELESLDPDLLVDLLDEYEIRLDAHLANTAAANRQGRTDIAVARIERDREAQSRLEAEALERWRKLHQLQRTAASAIGSVARRSVGAEAERRWLDRFDRACFPRVFRSTPADRQHAWILRRIPEDDVKQEAEAIHRKYEQEYRVLCGEEIALMVRGRMSLDVPVHSRMDPSTIESSAARKLYQDLLKSSGRRTRLTAEASAALEALLSDRQRKQMQADIAAAAYGRRR